MKIVRMVEHTCDNQPIVCVPVGSSPDMVCYILKIPRITNDFIYNIRLFIF